MAIREIRLWVQPAPTIGPSLPDLGPLLLAPLDLFDTLVLPPQGFDTAYVKTVVPFGAERSLDTNPLVTYYIQGLVKEGGVPVVRRVCAVRRDTLAPLASGMSDTAGHFHLSWRGYAGKTVVLIFDDTTDEMDYNCKVFDLVESVY